MTLNCPISCIQINFLIKRRCRSAMECCTTESQRQSLTDEGAQEKQRALRAIVVKKSISYFKDKKNRSVTDSCLLIRRKNLAAHLGLDMTVDKKDLDQIILATLPFPSSAKECAIRWENLLVKLYIDLFKIRYFSKARLYASTIHMLRSIRKLFIVFKVFTFCTMAHHKLDFVISRKKEEIMIVGLTT